MNIIIDFFMHFARCVFDTYLKRYVLIDIVPKIIQLIEFNYLTFFECHERNHIAHHFISLFK